MKKGLWIPVVLLFAVTLTSCFALTEPEESSGAVVAPTLAPVEEIESTEETELAEPTDAPEAEPTAEETAVPVQEETAVPIQEETSVPVQEESTAVPAVEPGGATVYEIDAGRSEARFTIEEVLRGSDTTVVGVSSNLAGQIVFDLANPAATQIGEVIINARDFATDNDFRNRAIANEILLTDTYEFITFTPTELVGLPDSAAVGETYDFQIVGDLTIIGETREVTFDVTVTIASATELQGLASVTILYADFGVMVPLSQFVTAVNEDVLLEIDFVAVAQ